MPFHFYKGLHKLYQPNNYHGFRRRYGNTEISDWCSETNLLKDDLLRYITAFLLCLQLLMECVNPFIVSILCALSAE